MANGGGGGAKPSDVAALLAVGSVNRLLAAHHDPPSRCGGPPFVLLHRRQVMARQSRIHAATIFSAECKHSAMVECPAALQGRKQHCGLDRRGGGGHKASVSDCLPPAAPIGLSPLLILTLCGPERVLVVSTEPEGGGGGGKGIYNNRSKSVEERGFTRRGFISPQP